MMTSPRPLVVAVRAGQSNANPVVWAAREAARRHTRLIVTALLPAVQHAPAVRGDVVAPLERWLELARQVEPGLEVAVDRTGAPGFRHVVDLSGSAALLVLGTTACEAEQPPPTAPLPERLAVHALCPVVVISPVAVQPANEHGRVVVGWSQGRSARHAFAAAAAEAASRAAWLVVVSVPAPVDPEVERMFGPFDRESDLLHAIAAVERAHPRLVVDLLHRAGDVTSELVEVAKGADLLVVGCHHSDQAWSNRPGPVAGRLLRTSPCPLMLVGAAAAQPSGRTLPASRPGPKAVASARSAADAELVGTPVPAASRKACSSAKEHL